MHPEVSWTLHWNQNAFLVEPCLYSVRIPPTPGKNGSGGRKDGERADDTGSGSGRNNDGMEGGGAAGGKGRPDNCMCHAIGVPCGFEESLVVLYKG